MSSSRNRYRRYLPHLQAAATLVQHPPPRLPPSSFQPTDLAQIVIDVGWPADAEGQAARLRLAESRARVRRLLG